MDKIVAAWNGKAIPDGLDENGRLAYIMLRAVYCEYRARVISQQEGEQIKDYLTRYALLGQGERASLLQYASPSCAPEQVSEIHRRSQTVKSLQPLIML